MSEDTPEDRVSVRDPDTGYIIVAARSKVGGFCSAALTEQETLELIEELEETLADRGVTRGEM